MMRRFFLALVILVASSGKSSAFQFPKIKFVGLTPKKDLNTPQIIVQNGPADAENLRLKLEKHCNILGQITSGEEISTSTSNGNGISFRWVPHLKESYEVADIIFQEVTQVLRDIHTPGDEGAKTSPHQLFLSFPSMSRPDYLTKIAEVLQSNKCKHLLGLENACAELYPSAPAPYLHITFATCNEKSEEVDDPKLYSGDNAITATKDWVNNFLGKYRLCPYTTSVTRAAVGLSSIGVPVGGVHVIRVDGTNLEMVEKRSYNTLRAAELVSAFWSEVVTLMQSSEEEYATSLVVFPEYDSDFEAFVDVCDSIVEPTVVATKATAFIGRAWFHPEYDADAVGHSDVIAGHAVPHEMVDGFMKSLDGGPLEYDNLVAANNKVRHTPHATINILRRSQLTAAGEFEKGLGDKKPKANSIYVRNAVRLSDAIKNKRDS